MMLGAADVISWAVNEVRRARGVTVAVDPFAGVGRRAVASAIASSTVCARCASIRCELRTNPASTALTIQSNSAPQ